MAAEILIVVIFPALLILAAGWDLASYTIPNALQIAVAVAFFAFAVAVGLSPMAIGYHVLSGVCGLILGFVFFALRFVGGGDAKLFAAVALWFGFKDLLMYALVASILGGGLTLILLAVRRFPLPEILCRQAWLLRLHDETADIPYGVALAAGALLILPQTEIFLKVAG